MRAFVSPRNNTRGEAPVLAEPDAVFQHGSETVIRVKDRRGRPHFRSQIFEYMEADGRQNCEALLALFQDISANRSRVESEDGNLTTQGDIPSEKMARLRRIGNDRRVDGKIERDAGRTRLGDHRLEVILLFEHPVLGCKW